MNIKIQPRFLFPTRNLMTVLFCLTVITSVEAQLTIALPSVNDLQPNTPNQTFPVSVANAGSAQPVTGISFNIQVADGGAAANGTINGPAITGVDVITSTIFQSNNNGPSGGGQIVPQVFERGTLTSSDVVDIPAGSSLIATVTVDTTGFLSGNWTMSLNTLNGSTKFTTTGSDIFPTLVNGSLSIIPETRFCALLTGLACGLFVLGQRFKKGHTLTPMSTKCGRSLFPL